MAPGPSRPPGSSAQTGGVFGPLGADALEQGGGRFMLAALAAEPGPVLLQGPAARSSSAKSR